MGEMTDAISAWVAHSSGLRGDALGPVLLLTVCLIVSGMGVAGRRHLTFGWAAAIQAGGLLAGLVVVALQVYQGGWLVRVDDVITDWLVRHRSLPMDRVALAVTDLVGPWEVGGTAVLIAAIAVLRFRSWPSGVVVLVTVGGASAACTLLKSLVARERPPVAIRQTLETDFSFPSGHVTATVALVGMVLVVTVSACRGAVRWALLVGAVVIVGAVGMSRLYLGVHYSTDVLGGALLGVTAVVIGRAALTHLVDDPGVDLRGDGEPTAMHVVAHDSR